MMKRMVAAVALVLLAALMGACLAESVGPDLPESSTKKDILSLQLVLRDAGYLRGASNGVYGEKTRKALGRWCEDHGVDIAKMSMLDLIIAIQRDNGILSGKALNEDNVSVYVTQSLLRQWGFYDGTPDGLFGSRTVSSLVVFMEYAKNDLVAYLQNREDSRREAAMQTAEGDMPQMYDAKLIDAGSIKTNGRLTRDWYEFMTSGYMPTGREVGLGDTGSDVLRVQRRLKKLRYIATGTDGTYGENTLLAVKYFQRLNGLPETGRADAETQKRMFEESAVRSTQYVARYMAQVSTQKNEVQIYGWSGEGYDRLEKTFVCTTGAESTPTIKGTYQAYGPVSEWYYMAPSNIWVQYAYRIRGPYYFHSILFKNRGDTEPTASSLSNLGNNASHGCIRLAVDDVKWIYENCPAGMTVVIE